MKHLVDGKIFEPSKARIAVDVTVRDMDACMYRKAVLYRTASGRWVVVTKPMGISWAQIVSDEHAKKLLTAAGKVDIIKKYFGKLSRA